MNKIKLIISIVIPLLIVLEPKLFTQYRLLNFFYFFLNVLLFVLLSLNCFTKKIFPKILFIWFFYNIFIIFSMIYNWNFEELDSTISNTVVVANIFMLIEKNINNKTFKQFLLCTSIILITYYVINFLTLIFYDKGVIPSHGLYHNFDDDYYFLGIKIMFQHYMYPLLTAIFLLKNYMSNKKWLFLLSVGMFFLFLNIVVFKQVSTAIIALIVILLSLIILRKITWKTSTMIICFLFINILIVFFNYANYFSFFIVNILGKDLTLSSRTIIWNQVLKALFNQSISNWFFGNAYNYTKGFHLAHNQLLHSLFTSGIIGTILLFYFIYSCGKKSSQKTKILYIISFGILIGCVTNNYFVYNVIYYVYACIYSLEHHEKKLLKY